MDSVAPYFASAPFSSLSVACLLYSGSRPENTVVPIRHYLIGHRFDLPLVYQSPTPPPPSPPISRKCSPVKASWPVAHFSLLVFLSLPCDSQDNAYDENVSLSLLSDSRRLTVSSGVRA